MVVVYPSFFPVDKTGAANGVVVLLIFPLAILSWSSFHVHWFLLEIAGTLWYPRVGRRASILPGICTYTQGGGGHWDLGFLNIFKYRWYLVGTSASTVLLGIIAAYLPTSCAYRDNDICAALIPASSCSRRGTGFTAALGGTDAGVSNWYCSMLTYSKYTPTHWIS